MSDTKYINQALGDNAKFYPNYLTNHVTSDFKFHLNNGIRLITDDSDRMVEEIAELKEFVCSLQLDVSNEIKLENLLAKLNQEGE